MISIRRRVATATLLMLGPAAAWSQAQTLESGKLTTFSRTLVVSAGSASAKAMVPLPHCTPGEVFHTHALAVGVQPRAGTEVPGRWAAQVMTYQISSTAATTAPLVVWGTGLAHAEARLPGGQWTGPRLDLLVSLTPGRVAPATTLFTFHVSGACAIPGPPIE
jgi:hypothetical protein